MESLYMSLLASGDDVLAPRDPSGNAAVTACSRVRSTAYAIFTPGDGTSP